VAAVVPSASRDPGWPSAAALGALSLVVATSSSRLFRGDAWTLPVLTDVVVAHLLLWLGRRLRLANGWAILLTVVAVVLVTVWTTYPSSTWFGLPLWSSARALISGFGRARQTMAQAVAPVRGAPGVDSVDALAFSVLAVLADWAAFRLRAGLESLLPSLVGFVAVCMLAGGQTSVRWAAALVSLAALFVVLHENELRRRRPLRLSGGTGNTRHLAQAAVGMTVMAVVGASIIGPRLPGAHAEAVIALRHRGSSGNSQRTTISPLVDIRSRLINQSDQQMFTVQASEPAYWRLTALDVFDGNIWSSDENYRTVNGPLPGAGTEAGGASLEQTFSIDGLDSIWMPAAFLPVRVATVQAAAWDATSDSLISRNSTSNGQDYTVTSEVPHFSGRQLDSATESGVAAPVLQHYLQLPAAVPPDVVELARRVTAGLSGPYQKALALQDYLRRNYTYSLAVQPGHSDTAIESFLFVNKKGYCEQFAGAYAVMARAIGLPTRVAVGFTPGVQEGDGLWSVLGLDAHAWPEVLLGQYGWVPFDPTPGRGIPGATSYTGVPAQEAQPTASTSPGTSPPASTAPPGSSPAPRGHLPPATRLPDQTGSHGHRLSRPLLALLALLAAALAWGVLVPSAKRARVTRRRRRARSGTDQVLAAWKEADDELAARGYGRAPSETLTEHARRAASQMGLEPVTAEALEALADHAAAAAYAPGGPSEATVDRARHLSAQVRDGVLGSSTWWTRLAHGLDPRPLVGSRRLDPT
jgi:transglutaminase-like putative cysteine protease